MFARTKNLNTQVTTCRLCGQRFSHPALGVPVIGETAPKHVLKFVTGLAQHLATSHQDEMTKFSGTIQDFSGLLIVNQFDTDDAGLMQRAEAIRADIHGKTRRHFLTDEKIEQLSYTLYLPPQSDDEPDDEAENREQFAAILRGVRDAYEEKGEYSPENQAARLIVTP